jgi:hypothetical protein
VEGEVAIKSGEEPRSKENDINFDFNYRQYDKHHKMNQSIFEFSRMFTDPMANT